MGLRRKIWINYAKKNGEVPFLEKKDLYKSSMNNMINKIKDT